jgi:hypothetical protein
VTSGRAERANRCGKPAAWLLSTIALRIPGPHQWFSVPAPTASPPSVMPTELCPRWISVSDSSPKRRGMSIESVSVCQGGAKGLRQGRLSVIRSNSRFCTWTSSGARCNETGP